MKSKTAKVRVIAREYYFSHGKKPRGFGCWFYSMKSGALEATFEMFGTYTEATKEAVKVAKKFGASEIKVGA